MKEKIKPIKQFTVSVNPDYVIWNENIENATRDAEVIVSPGCLALYLVNGQLRSILNPGQKWLIKSKEEEKSHSELALLGANIDKTFEVCCGVGNIPFKDFELNFDTVVGAHGECKIRVSQPLILYTTIGHSPVSADEIDAYVKLKLSEIMTTRLAEVLQHYDYNNIMTQQSVIASDLEKRFAQRLNDIGLEIVSFALAGIMFNEEYQEKRKEFFEKQNERKAEKEKRRNEAREQRAEIDNIIAIANAAQNINTAPQAPQAPATPSAPQAPGVNQPVKYCPRCGMKMEQSAIFCPGCGKKL